jgi:hypothetical protein
VPYRLLESRETKSGKGPHTPNYLLKRKKEEPSELICFKIYKSQIPVIEHAIETAALMLGSDKSRGICAYFLAGKCGRKWSPSVIGLDPKGFPPRLCHRSRFVHPNKEL